MAMVSALVCTVIAGDGSAKTKSTFFAFVFRDDLDASHFPDSPPYPNYNNKSLDTIPIGVPQYHRSFEP
jgi:hypothetical protein